MSEYYENCKISRFGLLEFGPMLLMGWFPSLSKISGQTQLNHSSLALKPLQMLHFGVNNNILEMLSLITNRNFGSTNRVQSFVPLCKYISCR